MKNSLTDSDKELHKKFSEYGANAKEWIGKCKLLLPHIAEKQIWKKKGFMSIYDYAAQLAGMNQRSVDDALWILRKIQDKPALLRVAEQRGINKVRPVVAIATVKNQDFWAEKASRLSRAALETYVRDLKQQENNGLDLRTGPQNKPVHSYGSGNGNSERIKPTTATYENVEMNVSAEVAETLRKLKGDKDWNEFMQELIQLKRAELQKTPAKPAPVRTNSRHIPADIKAYVLAQTGGRCAYPGCNRPYTSLHHTQRFALDHVHDPDHIVPLCTAHERLAHEGLIANEEKSPAQWQLRHGPDKNSDKFYIDSLVGTYR
ncbi:hypothetical protein COV82_01730 [Candidatus Peregrinibacteria bacterium CG11_big_fil_rev_8_21_14_0_20_46_8]|nr:MAG: hypothetical protein COV82_01730 [Candidatus Peregrinibacteria bacterium CG11_big_fil_rev_8_21_14_0_20_46_8]